MTAPESPQPSRANTPSTMPSRTELLAYLQSLNVLNSAYHNHKETSAWLAASVITTGVLTAAGALHVVQSLTFQGRTTIGFQWAMTSAFVLLVAATLSYVRRQLVLRRFAGLRVRAIHKVQLDLLARTTQPEDFTTERADPTPTLGRFKSLRDVLWARRLPDDWDKEWLPTVIVQKMTDDVTRRKDHVVLDPLEWNLYGIEVAALSVVLLAIWAS